MKYISVLLGVILCSQLLLAQQSKRDLSKIFSKLHISYISSADILTKRSPDKSTFNFNLTIGDQDLQLVLTEKNIIGSNYVVRVATPTGIIDETPANRPLTTIGQVKGDPDSKVALTINDGFVFGRIETNNKKYYIEPLSYYETSAKKDQYIIYDVADIIDNTPHTCGFNESVYRSQIMKEKVEKQAPVSKSAMMSCYEVDWAIASDFQMFQSYGSISGVENHNIGVALDVQTNYDDEFADEIQLFISEQFVSNCSSCDPWTSSNNAGTFLNSFTDWGPTGFSFAHDIGSIWTGRNFNGSTIGIAWLGVVCENLRYNALEDFSSNANLKRVMVAHELGHNFDATHDGSGGFIMSPSVNSTNSWSNNSINQIENHYLSRWCLATCVGSGLQPPAPSFTKDYVSQCSPGEVQFTDQSSNTPTTWSWEFEGAIPNTSSDQNPSVVFQNPGLFNVTLTVSNAAGSNTETFIDEIEILQQPFANWVYSAVGTTVTFDNISGFANDYFWSFGDGTFSTDEDPVHTFPADGTYQVNLAAINGICEDNYTLNITVVSFPTANIVASVTSGCTPLEVTFDASTSINTSSFQWNFEGGTPIASTAPTPIVTYNNAGVYDVELIVTSSVGLKDTLLLNDYITVDQLPTATFTAALSGLTASFTNNSQFNTTNLWNFGDGNTSMDPAPTHTYAQPGDYVVTLETTSPCGTISTQEIVDVEVAPSAIVNSNINGAPLCAATTIEFTAGEQNNLDTYQWTFQGGLPATSTDPDPIVDYAVSGDFDVTLIVSNNIGSDTVTLINYVVVADDPIAAFTYSDNQLTIDFTNTTLDGNSYTWDFGDGNSSTAESPVHTYSTPGVYGVTLIATNNCGSNTIMQNVSVQSVPVGGFMSDIQSGCIPFSVQYADASSNNTVSYAWIFEGGVPATSTDPNPVISYTTAGTFDVQLIASNAAGSDTILFTQYVDASDIPDAGLQVNTTGNQVSIVDQSQGATTVNYLLDGVIINNPNFVLPANGNYQVGVQATNICGVDEAYESVNINVYPIAQFSAGSTAGCGPLAVNYTSNSINATNLEWIFDGATPNSSTNSNPTVTYNASGSYMVSLITTNQYGADTISSVINIEVLLSPTAQFGYITNAATLTFNPEDVIATSYSWDFGDGNTSTAANPAHTYTSSGIYTVSLTVVNECGTNTSSQEIEIEVNTPVADLRANGGVNRGCVPFEVTFEDLSSNDPVAWEWEFEGGEPATSNIAAPTVTYNSAGSYDVRLSVTNSFGTSTVVIKDYIIVDDEPIASFDFASNELTVDFDYTGTVAASYIWDFGDGNGSVEISPTHTYTATGAYDVLLIIANSCGVDSTMQSVEVINTNVNDLSKEVDVTVYPNPVKNRLTIDIKGTLNEKGDWRLLDMQGRILLKDQISSFTNFLETIDITSVQNGTYILQLSTATKITNMKVIILK